MANVKKTTVFEKYAHEYDLITNAAAREEGHSKEVQALIDRFKPATVLDAGCASGLTSTLFARRGITAVGLDRSKGMLEQARLKSDGSNLPLSFRHGHFEKLPRDFDDSFDLVVCLANSISGLQNATSLRQAMKNFYRALRPGGWLVIQALNYASIKEDEIFPIKATTNEGIIWTRYSRRSGKRLEIHAVRIDTNQPGLPFEPFVHTFENFDPSAILTSFSHAGFRSIKRFGDLKLASRFTKKARDIVVVGLRPRK